MINSKAKGAKGERELSRLLKEYGYDTRRGQQYCGANGDADVIGLPGIYIECKRKEKLNIFEAIEQAVNDSGAKDMPFDYLLPTVFHRKNKCKWLVTMRFDDFSEMYTSSGVRGIYFKQKESENTYLYRWISEATEEAKKLEYAFPAISYRKSDTEWLVTLKIEDWINIYREWEAGNALGKEIDNET